MQPKKQEKKKYPVKIPNERSIGRMRNSIDCCLQGRHRNTITAGKGWITIIFIDKEISTVVTLVDKVAVTVTGKRDEKGKRCQRGQSREKYV